MTRSLLLLAACVLLASCAQWQDFSAPDVSLVDLKIRQARLLETDADLIIRVANPNPEPMVVRGGEYRLQLDGRDVGKGLSPSLLSIGPYESVLDTVPAHLSNPRLLARALSMVDKELFAYRMKSALRVEMPYGRRKVRSESEGELDMKKPPRDW